MELDIIRLCGHFYWVFIYWLENIYNGELTEEQKKVIEDSKKRYCKWLLSTSGYFDKNINGNWKGDEINGTVPEGTKILKSDEILNFKNYFFII